MMYGAFFPAGGGTWWRCSPCLSTNTHFSLNRSMSACVEVEGKSINVFVSERHASGTTNGMLYKTWINAEYNKLQNFFLSLIPAK